MPDYADQPSAPQLLSSRFHPGMRSEEVLLLHRFFYFILVNSASFTTERIAGSVTSKGEATESLIRFLTVFVTTWLKAMVSSSFGPRKRGP